MVDGTAVAPLAGYVVTPYPSAYGARVALGDVLVGGAEELLVGAGPDTASSATMTSYRYDGSALRRIQSIDAFPGASYGANVAAGQLGYQQLVRPGSADADVAPGTRRAQVNCFRAHAGSP